MSPKSMKNRKSLFRWLALTGVVASPAAWADGSSPKDAVEVVVEGGV